MESGIRILLLSRSLLTLPGCARAQLVPRPPAMRARRRRKPPSSRRPTQQADADDDASRRRGSSSRRSRAARSRCPRSTAENIELGGVLGALSIEDFGTNPVYGVTAAYHVTEDFFFQAEAGRSTAGQHQLRDPRRQHRSCLPEMRDASRITTSRSATTSCRARSFSVATSP